MNTHKLAVLSCFLLISLSQTFASNNGGLATWDDVVKTVASGIYRQVKDTLKAYEDAHECGPLGDVGPPTLVFPPPLPPTLSPPAPAPAPSDQAPSPTPAYTPSPSPSPDLSPEYSPSPSPDPSPESPPSPNPSPRSAPSPSPTISPPTHSPAPGPSPPPGSNGPSIGPHTGYPTCVVKHRCNCTCGDDTKYFSYSCDSKQPCWCDCFSGHDLLLQIPILKKND